MNGLLASRLCARKLQEAGPSTPLRFAPDDSKNGAQRCYAWSGTVEACNANHGPRNDLYEFGDWQRAEAI